MERGKRGRSPATGKGDGQEGARGASTTPGTTPVTTPGTTPVTTPGATDPPETPVPISLTGIELQQRDDLVSDAEAAGSLPQDLVVFHGYLGNAHDSLHPNNRRLYLTLQFNEYIEFRSEDVVMFRDLGGEVLDEMAVWLKREASIKHVRMETLDLQRNYLQGSMGLSAAPQGLSPAGQAHLGGGSFLTCGGGSFLTCGGGSFLTCGGGSFLTCGGGSFLTCGGGSFLTCGGGSFLTCGGGK